MEDGQAPTGDDPSLEEEMANIELPPLEPEATQESEPEPAPKKKRNRKLKFNYDENGRVAGADVEEE
jgi:hypothetical protein